MDYTLVSHKIVKRVTGDECRFTVRREDGFEISDTIPSLDYLDEYLNRLTVVSREPTIDKELLSVLSNIQQSAKEGGFSFIKSSPNCTLDELIEYLTNTIGEDPAVVTKILYMYQAAAYRDGGILTNDFTAFRNFVVDNTTEFLMSL